MKSPVVAACVAAVLLASACGGDETEPTDEGSSSPSGTFTATGVVALKISATATSGDGCTGAIPPERYGYSDIKAGTRLIVRGDDGSTAATGHLGQGSSSTPPTTSPHAPGPQDCDFPFSIKDIPSGEEPYFVEVGDQRGGIEFAEEEADSLKIPLIRAA